MDPVKKTAILDGSLVRPLRIGRKAIIVHNGKLLHTATVTGIKEYNAENICFETLDTYYRISLSGYPKTTAALQIPLYAAA